MKKIIGPFIFLCLCFSSSFSQEILLSCTFEDYYSKHFIRSGLNIENVDLSEIHGSPYLNDQFVKGEILVTTNIKYIEVPLRYNIYNDEMEFENAKKESFNLDKTILKSIFIDNREFIYYPISGDERSYFQVITKGKLTLLKRYQVRYIKAEPTKPFSDPIPAKFQNVAPCFFAMFENVEAKRIDSIKDLLSILPTHKTEVKEFIKSKSLKLNKEAEIKECFEYFNSLAK